MIDIDKDLRDFQQLSKDEQIQYSKTLAQEAVRAIFFAISAVFLCSALFLTSNSSALWLSPLILVAAYPVSKLLSSKTENFVNRFIFSLASAGPEEMNRRMSVFSSIYKQALHDLKQPPGMTTIGLLIGISLFLCGILFSIVSV